MIARSPALPPAGRVPAGVQTPLHLPSVVQAGRRGGALGASFLVTALFAPLAHLASLRKILLGVALIDIPLRIDQNFGYLADAEELGAVPGFNISVTTAALAGLYAAWLIEVMVSRVNRGRMRRIPFGQLLPLTAYVCCVVLSLVRAQDVGLYGRGLFLLAQMFLLAIYLATWTRTWRDVRFVVTCLLIGLALESLIIVGMAVTGSDFMVAGLTGRVDSYAADDEFGIAARYGGTVGSPNTAAAYLEMLLAPALAVLATGMSRPRKILAAVALGCGLAAMVVTASRGGWIAALLSLVIVGLSLFRGRKLPLAVPLTLVAILSVVAIVFHQSITNRLAGEDRGAASSRVPLMVTAFDIIEEDPLLGVGANNYVMAMEARKSTFTADFYYTVHNQYLLVWAETGIAGLAAFLWFLGATLWRGWRRWKSADAYLSPLALGFTAALAGQMVHMNVDIFNSRPQVQLLVVVAVLIAVMSRMEPLAPPASPGGAAAVRVR